MPVDVLTADKNYVLTLGAAGLINPSTGQPATDRETGEVLSAVGLLQLSDGKADLLKVKVPSSKVPEGLAVGTPVRPVGLVAMPWAQLKGNGQLSEGVSFRAAAIEVADTSAFFGAPSSVTAAALGAKTTAPAANSKMENAK
jgi:hypothetical protein